jgi:hypothetical protein
LNSAALGIVGGFEFWKGERGGKVGQPLPERYA